MALFRDGPTSHLLHPNRILEKKSLRRRLSEEENVSYTYIASQEIALMTVISFARHRYFECKSYPSIQCKKMLPWPRDSCRFSAIFRHLLTRVTLSGRYVSDAWSQREQRQTSWNRASGVALWFIIFGVAWLIVYCLGAFENHYSLGAALFPLPSSHIAAVKAFLLHSFIDREYFPFSSMFGGERRELLSLFYALVEPF